MKKRGEEEVGDGDVEGSGGGRIRSGVFVRCAGTEANDETVNMSKDSEHK